MYRYILILIIWIIASINNYLKAQNCTLDPLSPVSAVHLKDGDLIIDGSCDGVVLTAANGACFRVLLNEDGAYYTEFIECTFIPCNVPADFECKTIIKAVDFNGSVTYNSNEIVCVTPSSVPCSGSQPTLISSFSGDPTDTVRIYNCSDFNDFPHSIGTAMFIWDLIDIDNDGLIDTTFKEPCFSILEVLDPQGMCDF